MTQATFQKLWLLNLASNADLMKISKEKKKNHDRELQEDVLGD